MRGQGGEKLDGGGPWPLAGIVLDDLDQLRAKVPRRQWAKRLTGSSGVVLGQAAGVVGTVMVPATIFDL